MDFKIRGKQAAIDAVLGPSEEENSIRKLAMSRVPLALVKDLRGGAGISPSFPRRRQGKAEKPSPSRGLMRVSREGAVGPNRRARQLFANGYYSRMSISMTRHAHREKVSAWKDLRRRTASAREALWEAEWDAQNNDLLRSRNPAVSHTCKGRSTTAITTFGPRRCRQRTGFPPMSFIRPKFRAHVKAHKTVIGNERWFRKGPPFLGKPFTVKKDGEAARHR